MKHYVPVGLPAQAPLVVVMHGCTQTADGYDHGAGWSALADVHGFALLYPEQQAANNPNSCFSWFVPEDSTRDRGELLSVRQMIDRMVGEHDLDRRRIHVTGLSAGGAMANALLAGYPELFAAGAIIAGLPYGAARNVGEAFGSMFQGGERSPQELGDLVRSASSHAGPWPRIAVWHGTADRTVVHSNARQIALQWANVHRLPDAPEEVAAGQGYRRFTWKDAQGRAQVEEHAIEGMAHGTPLSVGDAWDQGGTAGPYMLDVGISSTHEIARFFGVAGAHGGERSVPTPAARVVPAAQVVNAEQSEADDARPAAIMSGIERAPVAPPVAKDATSDFVRSTIEGALRSAGLMR
jgi:poly(hydroxyalkanoate) depolymerase family esterase